MNITTDREKYIGNTAIGLIGSVSAYFWCPKVISKQYTRLCKKYGYRFSLQEQNEIWKSAQKAFANSSIKDSVQIVDYNITNWEPIADKIVQSRRDYMKNIKNPFVKLISKTWPNDTEFKEQLIWYARGRNAC